MTIRNISQRKPRQTASGSVLLTSNEADNVNLTIQNFGLLRPLKGIAGSCDEWRPREKPEGYWQRWMSNLRERDQPYLSWHGKDERYRGEICLRFYSIVYMRVSGRALPNAGPGVNTYYSRFSQTNDISKRSEKDELIDGDPWVVTGFGSSILIIPACSVKVGRGQTLDTEMTTSWATWRAQASRNR